jgi:hypothetical protein
MKTDDTYSIDTCVQIKITQATGVIVGYHGIGLPQHKQYIVLLDELVTWPHPYKAIVLFQNQFDVLQTNKEETTLVEFKFLTLGDLKDFSQEEIKQHLISNYEAEPNDVNQYQILIAYEKVGDYGCDSSSFFLLRRIDDNSLWEIHGSHCSCNGFEGQFEPTRTTTTYLNSEHFHFHCSGYDDDNSNENAVKNWIAEHLNPRFKITY